MGVQGEKKLQEFERLGETWEAYRVKIQEGFSNMVDTKSSRQNSMTVS